jgi:hypothetical protein
MGEKLREAETNGVRGHSFGIAGIICLNSVGAENAYSHCFRADALPITHRARARQRRVGGWSVGPRDQAVDACPAGWARAHNRGRMLAERRGEPCQGPALARRVRVAFEPGHGGDAYPGPVGQLSCDRPRWRRNCRSRWPSRTVIHHRSGRPALVMWQASRAGPRPCESDGRRRCPNQQQGR